MHTMFGVVRILVGLLGAFAVLVIILCSIGIYFRCTMVYCKSKRRLDGKTAIVTGSSSGIGFEVALDLASRGARVIVTCPFDDEGNRARDVISEKSCNKNVIFMNLDLASLAATRKFVDDFIVSETRLDILVNNAGVMGPNVLTGDGLNLIMQVNYVGPFLLTLLLLPLLKKTGTLDEPVRIVNTASGSHIFGKYDFDCLYSSSEGLMQYYMSSKLWVAMLTRHLADKLSGSNVVVNTTDPSVAVTKIMNALGYVIYVIYIILKILIAYAYPSAKCGAQNTIFLSVDESVTFKVSGKYYRNCKSVSDHFKVKDCKQLQLLWEKSLNLLKLTENTINSV